MIDFAAFKKFFLMSLIGSLIVSALVAVVVVLSGEFNEVSGRVLTTLAMVVLHSLVSLGFIWDDERKDTFDKLGFFTNVLFLLIVVSFMTSIFGIWKIIDWDIVTKLYLTYFVVVFASLHGDLLSKATGKENKIDLMIYANYFFMTIVALMLQPAIYVDNAYEIFGEMYFRVLGAVAIIDGTLSVLVMIFYKLYMKSHPEAVNPFAYEMTDPTGKIVKKNLNGCAVAIIVYIVIQVFLSVSGMIANLNYQRDHSVYVK